ncbi:MAG TPA: OPT family oligopeptide transporter [Kofleriaceae bacterium]|nr:OPT family oligopeptide transporter [Kofleriaceae bacterium]
MSEEPELDVPKAKLMKDELEALGGKGPSPHALHPPGTTEVPLLERFDELKGEITAKAVIAGIVVALIMGSAYPYMVLKLGFGPNVSVVAAFFGFLFLRALDFGGGKHYNRWQNNLVEAAGTSAAQTAFMCVLLGAFDLLRHNTGGALGIELTPLMSFLWLTTACTLGVLLAAPLRRHFVVDEKLPYPDGTAAAETVLVLDPPRQATEEVRRKALRAFKAVMWGMALSGLVMLFREDAKIVPHLRGLLDHISGALAGLVPNIPEGFEAPWTMFERVVSGTAPDGTAMQVVHGVVLANMAVGASYSLLSVGSGMIVGLRIDVGMLIGAVFAWVVMPYFLVKYAVPIHHTKSAAEAATAMVATDTPTRTEVLFWVMWPATGILVAGGLTSLALRWRLLIETFRSLRNARIGTSEMPLSFIGTGVVISAIGLCIVQRTLLHMPVWMTLAAMVLSLPLMLVGLRVLGETNWGPISALSNMMQGVFAAIAPGNVTANMVASGTTGTIATSSEAIMQDYRAAQIIGSKPRNITIMQLLAVPIGAAAVSWMYPVFRATYHIFDTTDPVTGKVIKAQLTSPISNKWAGFAQLLKDGVSALPTSALYALIIFSVIGVVFTVVEARPGLRKYVPSPTAMGIGMIVPFSVVFTMFLGGVVGYVWETRYKASAKVYLLPLASGLIAGEALVAVVASIYLYLIGS